MKKFISFVATSAILLNSFAAPLSAIAQEITPTPAPTPEATSTPDPSPEITPAPTEDPTPAPSETPADLATPTVEPTIVPEETSIPTPTDQVVQTQAPESVPTTPGPPAEIASPQASDIPTPTFTPVITDENAEVTTEIITSELFPETVQENSVIKLITDKLDYTPSEIAIITGSGFTTDKTYSLTVSSSDDPATTTTVDVTASEDGEFTYEYQLDGNYRPNYLVEVKDGEELIVSTTFTDSRAVVSLKLNSVEMTGTAKIYVLASSTIQADVKVNITDNSDWKSTGWRISTTAPGTYNGCFNSTNYNTNGDHDTSFNMSAPGSAGTYNVYARAFSNEDCTGGSTGSFSFSGGVVVVSGLPSNTKLYQWETKPSGNWITGNLGSSNSDYKEGDSVPFRLDVGGLSTGSYSFSLCRDYKNGTKYGYYEITPYNTSKTPSVGTITSTSGNFSGVNITINSVDEIGGQGSCGSGQRETKLVITSSGSATAYILWGGKLAKPSDPGVGSGNGATSYPGSSLQMQLLSPSKSVQINPAGIIPETPQTGTIELKKAWVGVGGQTTLNIGTSNAGTQIASVQTGASGSNPLTTGIKTVNAGTYYVSETGGLTNYSSSLACLKNGNTYTPGTNNSLVVAANDVFVCTFTNTSRTGSIVAHKFQDNDRDGIQDPAGRNPRVNPGEANLSGWTMNLFSGSNCTGTAVASGSTDSSGNFTFSNISYGSYSVSEVLQSQDIARDWINTTPICQNITLDQSQETVNFGNFLQNFLNVCKVNDLNADGNPSDEPWMNGWIFTMTGPSGYSRTQTTGDSQQGCTRFKNLNNGTYTVTETPQSGWTQTTSQNNPNSYTFDAGVQGMGATIYITNTRSGSIKIVKDSQPNDGQDFRFNIYTTAGSVGTVILDDNNSGSTPNNYTFKDLAYGSYSIAEQPVEGWNLADASCTGGSAESWNFTNGILNVTISNSEDFVCTFVNQKSGSIEGYKWNDNNGNGTRDREWHDGYCHYGHCHDGYWGDYIESKLSGWRIFIDGNNDGIYQDGERYDNTDSNGYYFGNLKPGDYKICEVEKTSEGWHNTSGGVCQNVTVGNGEGVTGKNFGNQRTGSIKVCKVIIDPNNNISNGSVFAGDTFTINWDKGLSPTVFTAGYEPNEKLFSDSEVNDAYCKTISDIPVSTYKYSAEVINNPSNWTSGKYNDQYSSKVIDLGDFYSYGSNTDSNGEINLDLVGPSRTLVILNQYIFVEDPKLELTKTNSVGTAIPAGSTITYTLNIKNSGNVNVNNVEVTDFLPGGFTYIAGSTTGATTSDPTITGGKLTWKIEEISIDKNVEISYKIRTANDITNGTYVNYATCKANTQKPISEFTLRIAAVEITDQNTTSCNTDDSSVKIDNSLSYGGSLGGQVLGATTMLPATGNPTWILLAALGLTGTGIYLNIRSKKTKQICKKLIK